MIHVREHLFQMKEWAQSSLSNSCLDTIIWLSQIRATMCCGEVGKQALSVVCHYKKKDPVPALA